MTANEPCACATILYPWLGAELPDHLCDTTAAASVKQWIEANGGPHDRPIFLPDGTPVEARAPYRIVPRDPFTYKLMPKPADSEFHGSEGYLWAGGVPGHLVLCLNEERTLLDDWPDPPRGRLYCVLDRWAEEGPKSRRVGEVRRQLQHLNVQILAEIIRHCNDIGPDKIGIMLRITARQLHPWGATPSLVRFILGEALYEAIRRGGDTQALHRTLAALRPPEGPSRGLLVRCLVLTTVSPETFRRYNKPFAYRVATTIVGEPTDDLLRQAGRLRAEIRSKLVQWFGTHPLEGLTDLRAANTAGGRPRADDPVNEWIAEHLAGRLTRKELERRALRYWREQDPSTPLDTRKKRLRERLRRAR